MSVSVFAQNLFNEKIDVCNTVDFCVDCGTPKATVDAFTLDYISDKINHKYNFQRSSGTISFQVMVDEIGFSCVLSHTDATNSPLTYDLIRYLNGCIWKPAIVNGKPVNSSVVVVFNIVYGKIGGQMKRMDLSEMKDPGQPKILNTQFTYNNASLNSYDFTVWTKYNSPLPDNIGQACVVDKSDVLWYATAAGLTRFDGKMFNAVNEVNSPFTSTTAIHSIAVDKDDNKWMFANKAIYMCNNKGWQLFDSTHFVISRAYRIINNPSGELFFTNKKGLLILRNDKIRLVDKKLIWQMPSNNVYYAYYDKNQRLWIGTDKGCIMIDKKQNVTTFNTSNTPLKNVSISNIAEDEGGNLYFSLSDYKNTDGDSDEEGIAVLKADGTWSHYNDKNSGMPSNHVNTLWFDKFENVLWIGTQQSGLVRFDLKNGWENYNNANSAMAGYEINEITQDSKGVIYAATANGMLRVKKK